MKCPFRWVGILAVVAFAATGALGRAQQVQFGVQGGLNIPMGNLGDALDHRLGFTFGGHAGLYYGDGHELRPRVDYTTYSGGYHPIGHGAFDKNDITVLSLGADYVYYTLQRKEGLYLTMGLGYQFWSVSPHSGSSTSNNSLSLAAGVGYRPNKQWAFEGRFLTGQFRSNNGQANALQAVALFRF